MLKTDTIKIILTVITIAILRECIHTKDYALSTNIIIILTLVLIVSFIVEFLHQLYQSKKS